MTSSPPIKPTRHLRASDLRALTLLATQATSAVASIAEGVHQSVWRTMGAPSGASAAKSRGLTGLIYKSITQVTHVVGQGVAAALTRLEPLLHRLEDQSTESSERAAVIAAINGVMGDHLQATANPLATPMTLRLADKVLDESVPLDATHLSGKVLIVIHGLCMNELQWSGQHAGRPVNHATALADAFGYTPVYVRYNTGLHVSQNGVELARQLDALVQRWPVPVTELSVLTHSMGGLVIRSALFEATQRAMTWCSHLKNIVFLGTPHHGAPLERAGNWIDVILGSTPYSRPFAKLGQLRSAGVTDLRYGLVLDSDWQGIERFRRQPDRRTPVPLPENVACFAVAATLAAKRSAVADRLVGDGLVPLHSGLGQHDDPLRCLNFAPDRQWIAYRTSHMALLDSPAVTAQLVRWLTPV